jgi:hypothetical protein
VLRAKSNLFDALDLPYDPGFEMPDYKELGAEIWKLGTVIDFRTLDGHRPREKPVVLLPEDHIYLDLPSVVTPTDYGELCRPEF